MRISSLLVAALITTGCAAGTNESLRFETAFTRAAAIPLANACTSTELLPDGARSLESWFDMEATTPALEAAWPESPSTVLFAIMPSNDGAGVWSVTSDVPNDTTISPLIEAFTASRRNVAIPDEGLMIFVGDAAGPRPTLVEGFSSCPAQLVGEAGVAARLLEVAEEVKEEAGVHRIVAIRVDDVGRPLTVLYQGEGDLAEQSDLEALWILASARFHPAFVHGVPVGSLAPLEDSDLGEAPIKETYIRGLESNLFGRRRAHLRQESLGLTAEWDHRQEYRAAASASASGMISKPSGLDWRLRNNAIGTDFSGGANGLKYFHPQRVWTANGFINARNAPLVHVDIYGRRR